jgi:hypothetical protein
MTDQFPINIELREYLEDAQAFRRTCSIRFKGENGGVAHIKAKIIELAGELGEEYIKLDNSMEIKLFNLLDVDGRSAYPAC